MGVEIKESPVSGEEFEEMKRFVCDYLSASVEAEEEGGRMRWYPWHSAEYRFNHILNVAELAAEIAEKEGANVDVTRVAALFTISPSSRPTRTSTPRRARGSHANTSSRARSSPSRSSRRSVTPSPNTPTRATSRTSPLRRSA